MKQTKVRFIVDIALVAMLVFEMFYLLTGNTLHEIVGALFFVTIGIHLFLTRKMSGALVKSATGGQHTRENMSFTGAIRLVLAVLLIVNAVVLLASSLATSNLLMALGISLAGSAYDAWVVVHIISAYTMCGVVALHATAHWASLFKGAHIPYNPARRQAINTWTMGAASVGAVLLGLAWIDPVKERMNMAFAAGAANNTQDGTRDFERGDNSSSLPDSQQTPDESLGNGYGRRSRRGQDNGYSFNDSGSGNSGNGNSNNDSGNSGSSPFDGFGSGGSGSDSSNGSGSGNSGSSGICTLCPKRCSLSSPRCNRPYSAGLIGS